MDRQLYRCDGECGLELNLINARGEDCPRCSGHFQPVHPLAINIVGTEPAMCDKHGCSNQAVVYFKDPDRDISRMRCKEHEFSHIVYADEDISAEIDKMFAEVDRALFNEAEMDRYGETD